MKNLIACLTVCMLSGVAVADTWTVDDDGKADFDNIQDAVDAASDGDEIVVMPGTYTSTADEVVDMRGKAVWLHSSEGQEVTIIDGENARRGILCLNAKKIDQTIIEGFTISNGLTGLTFPGAGMYCSGICPKITNCIFSYNKCDGAYNAGGGLAIVGSPVDISDCLFENNYAYRGGGVTIFTKHTGGNVVGKSSITNCVFRENVTIQGALFIDWWPQSPSTELDLVGCEFRDNTAKEDGGAIRVWSSEGVIAIDKCVFVNNEAMSGEGGAIAAGESRWRITNCTFSENKSAANGGAIRFRDLWDESIISDTVFDSNHAEGTGGGVFNAEMLDPLNPTIENCTFTGNTAYYGGGMYNYDSIPTLTDCVFIGNTAVELGGGMSNDSSNPTLTNCAFTNNTTDGNGGGMYNNGGSNPSLTGTTVCGNTPDQIYGDWIDDGGNTIAEECCPDINGDGYVDVSDLLAVIAAWGIDCDGCSEDVNNDANVDVTDLLMVIGNWGECE